MRKNRFFIIKSFIVSRQERQPKSLSQIMKLCANFVGKHQEIMELYTKIQQVGFLIWQFLRWERRWSSHEKRTRKIFNFLVIHGLKLMYLWKAYKTNWRNLCEYLKFTNWTEISIFIRIVRIEISLIIRNSV